MIPTLAEAKQHLRVESDFLEDDDYIQNLITAAVDYTEIFCDASIGDLNKPAVKQAILIKVGDFYVMDRTSYTNIKNQETFERLLIHYRKITF
ncbi:MAG: phage gp6-like head-tail connector protein [Chloroflexia bacterium]|nr:phage gp6-like head-tail connector protein [Chloroflexia bacterium]